VKTARALRALAALLSYPEPALFAALPEIRAAIAAERRMGRANRARVLELIDEIERGEPLALQETYVALFDRGRATSLNLFEHLHGDSRDRGQAMADLAATYQRGGLRLATTELPDALPVLLEFLSTRRLDEARAMLGDCAHVVRRIGEALGERRSRYAAIPAALLAIAGERGFEWKPLPALAANDDEALDREWAEAPVTFGCESAMRGATAPQPVRFIRKAALTETAK
jgi:nitrate reductase delta subunit